LVAFGQQGKRATKVAGSGSEQCRAPGLDVKTIKSALAEANRLNAQSRQTFALLADLTTFIHAPSTLL
jgi:hypothetical protein